MAFKKGQSGNPTGRPKREKSKTVLVREAWERLTSTKPYLVEEALERGLTGGRPLGFLELGARVMKEIGQQDDQKANVTIILNSPLNPKALKPMGEAIRVREETAHPALPENTEPDMTLLEKE